MLCSLRCLCALTLLTVYCVGEVSCECLKEATFNHYKDNHVYSKSDVEKDWAKTNGPYKMIKGGNGGPALTTIDGGAIRGKFRKGEILGYETGFTWYALHDKQYEEATMAYKVKFSPGFDWTKGGKLPGLCGGEGKGSACPVGCSEVTKDRGFSTRLMWRSGGRVVTYAYYPDKPKSIRCGEDWKWSKKFQSGKWHQIRMWQKLNSPGKKDGEFKAWLDDEQVLHKKGIRYRYRGEFKISRSYITTYVGGSSVSLFAPNKDQYIWFKDFETWSGGGSSDCSSVPSSSSPPSNRSPAKSSPKSSSSSSVKQKGVGTQQASKDIRGYALVLEEAGWDVPGNIGKRRAKADRQATGRDRIVQYTLFCLDACNNKRGCVGFNLNADHCWFKDSGMMSATPQYKGVSSQGWRWLYAKKDEVATQSAPDAGNGEIKLGLHTYRMYHQSACGSLTTLRTQDCSSNWVITVNWTEEIQGHRLKWWGLDQLEQKEQTAMFHATEVNTGICFYWNDTEEEVTEEQIASWISVTAACESA